MPNQHSPHLTRFLSDFTLGFSDGLTVPFALTAGLSSLGRAETVIYAGLAELCAGSISMGIGGYLSALDEVPPSSSSSASSLVSSSSEFSSSSSQPRRDDGGDVEELRGMLLDRSSGETTPRDSFDEKSPEAHEYAVRRYLAPLGLPPSTVSDILSTITDRPDGLQHTAATLRSHQADLSSPSSPTHDHSLIPVAAPVWPVASGLSISLGYVIGGAIPLLPYLFAPTVGLALRWSIGLCLVALFSFGFGKSWLLRRGDDGCSTSWRRCVWEGSQMLVLGSLAAGAAVLCVNLVDRASDDSG